MNCLGKESPDWVGPGELLVGWAWIPQEGCLAHKRGVTGSSETRLTIGQE